jgi:hypothetical protein
MTQSGSGVCIAAVEDTRVISYSIASSAMASNFRGTSRPRALGGFEADVRIYLPFK